MTITIIMMVLSAYRRDHFSSGNTPARTKYVLLYIAKIPGAMLMQLLKPSCYVNKSCRFTKAIF